MLFKEIVDGRTDGRRRTLKDHKSSLSTSCSGELKILQIHKWLTLLIVFSDSKSRTPYSPQPVAVEVGGGVVKGQPVLVTGTHLGQHVQPVTQGTRLAIFIHISPILFESDCT